MKTLDFRGFPVDSNIHLDSELNIYFHFFPYNKNIYKATIAKMAMKNTANMIVSDLNKSLMFGSLLRFIAPQIRNERKYAPTIKITIFATKRATPAIEIDNNMFISDAILVI